MKDSYILAIESSCDDTGASVFKNEILLSNIVAGQDVHSEWGGVVPELASRAHHQHIIPVVDKAIKTARIDKDQINAIAFTRGPGLMGPLLVGTQFAKAFALANDIPLIEVNHMQAHVMAHFIEDPKPKLPFLCLTASGGHTQIVLVEGPLKTKLIGQTRDDAAGEAFDKSAKLLGLGYPGGPKIDQWGKKGNIRFPFPEPNVAGYDFSFSGLKTAIMYFIRDELEKDPGFIQNNLADLCASIQNRIVSILLNKLKRASKDLGIKEIAIAGGVSANSRFRELLEEYGKKYEWNTYSPRFQFCTDNAAMIGITAYYKYLNKEFTDLSITPSARLKL